MNDDTISRKATIDAMEEIDWYHINRDGQLVHGANSKEDEPLYMSSDVYEVLNAMPSAQPVDKGINVPCTDTISRQAACDAVCKAGCDSGFCGVECPEVMALRNLQPAQPEPPWIPVSERLPEQGRPILFCDVDGDVFHGFYKHSQWNEFLASYPIVNVVAWMPQPKSYKGG